MRIDRLLLCFALVATPASRALCQDSAGQPSVVVASQGFPVIGLDHDAPAPVAADMRPLASAYRPNHWRKGVLIGAGVGVLLATVVLTTCNTDANQDCPGWTRASITFVGATGVGALIGALIPRGDVPTEDANGE